MSHSITLHIGQAEFDGIVNSFLDDNISGIEELEERSTAEQIIEKYLISKFESFLETACEEAEDSKSFEQAVSAALLAEENARWEDLNQRQPLAA